MKLKILILIIFTLWQNFVFSQNDEHNSYMKAISEIHYNRFDSAEKIIKELISKNSRDDKLFMILGNCYYKQEKYTNAIEQYKQAIKQKNNYALYLTAECYSKINNPYSAVEYLKIYLKTNNKLLQSQIKKNPAFADIEDTKVWINLWKEEHYNNYEKKIDEAKFMIYKEDYANAFHITDILILKNKRRHKAHEIQGDLLMMTKDYKKAAKSYSIASEIQKHNYNYRKKASNAYFKAEKYNKSYKHCIEAIKENPYDSDIYLLKTKIEIKQKKYDEAQNTINSFLTYYTENDEALNLAGIISYNKKEYINALEKYSKCIKNDASRTEYFINRADTYMAVSMYKNAEKDLSMALDLNPKQAEVYYKRGIAKIKSYNNEDACFDFQKAFNLGYYKASDYIVKYCK